MIGERTFGSIDRRHVMLRWWLPWALLEYRRGGVITPTRRTLLSWACWRRVLRQWSDTEFRWVAHYGTNSRCYCEGGWTQNVSLRICGFGFWLSYSHYKGPVPCWCDRAIAELDAGGQG